MGEHQIPRIHPKQEPGKIALVLHMGVLHGAPLSDRIIEGSSEEDMKDIHTQLHDLIEDHKIGQTTEN